jgi:monovalent cation:H+ antiporter-2, CPA2 family
VVSLRRADGKPIDPTLDPMLTDGDTLVLSGHPEALAIAEEKLLRG